jgi:homoserine kinase
MQRTSSPLKASMRFRGVVPRSVSVHDLKIPQIWHSLLISYCSAASWATTELAVTDATAEVAEAVAVTTISAVETTRLDAEAIAAVAAGPRVEALILGSFNNEPDPGSTMSGMLGVEEGVQIMK